MKARPLYILNAKKLLQPSFRYLGRYAIGAFDAELSIRCLKCSFRFLEDVNASGDECQSKDVATLLRLSLFYNRFRNEQQIFYFLHQSKPCLELLFWTRRPDWYTPAHFDLLVDYLLHRCDSLDFDSIGDIFVVLAGLCDSPRTSEGKHMYVETMIRFMGPGIPHRTRRAALNASYMVRADVAAIGLDDGSLRYRFSQALASVVLDCNSNAEHHTTRFDNNTFKSPSFFDVGRRNLCYLKLLRLLAQEPAWYEQLQLSGHFDGFSVLDVSAKSCG